MIPLWKSPVKQPLELPVDVGFGPIEVPVELPGLSRRDSINKNNLQTVTFFLPRRQTNHNCNSSRRYLDHLKKPRFSIKKQM